MKFSYLSIIALFAFLASCGSNETTQKETVRTVKAATAIPLSSIDKDFAGVVATERFSNLAFRVSGQLERLNIVAGQRVKKGDVIAELDTRDYVLQLEVDKAAYETAKSQIDRFKRLYEMEAVSKQDYENAHTNYERAKASYENSQNKIIDTKLIAPFAGTIQKKLVENFQKVQAGEPIVMLVDPTDLYVWFTVADNTWPLLQGEKNFVVEFDAFKGKEYKARVKEIMDVSPDGSGIPVTLFIEDPEFDAVRNFIKPGFSCLVKMNVPTNNATSVAVPLTAVFSDRETKETSVWVVSTETNTVTRRVVKLGNLTSSDMVGVESGLNAKEIVVTAGVAQLKQGEKVKVIQ